MLRIDVRDYPEVADGESLRNLLVHRDYSFSASALVSIYADRMEFVKNHGEIIRNDVENLLGISASTASRILRRMVRNNILEQRGKARNTKYTLLE